jgi:hypothetical protein
MKSFIINLRHILLESQNPEEMGGVCSACMRCENCIRNVRKT